MGSDFNMKVVDQPIFAQVYEFTRRCLLKAPVVQMDSWQSQDVRSHRSFDTHEIRNHIFTMKVPDNVGDLVLEVEPDLPWAEDHFLERVSGEPLNPPPSEKDWPHHKGHREEHLTGEKYSHSYPERLWPKRANGVYDGVYGPHWGIRYQLGDLRDVVDLLAKDPTTRQAFVPIWFPEDTGVVHGERVPCTLGYHFLIREGKLHCTYLIRSVDFVRHFRNDVYMAARLVQWMAKELSDPMETSEPVLPGTLIMHTMSMHLFVGDRHRVEFKEASAH